MANIGLSICGCICACLLVTVSNFAIIIGLLIFALGIVLTVGLNWVTANSSVKQLLEELSNLLKEQAKLELDVSDLVRSISSVTGTMGIVFIVVGIVVVAVSCAGCIGGCCKVRSCLIIYAVVVGVFFLAQLTVVIIWYANSNILKSSARAAMEGSVSRYTGFSSDSVESLLQNLLQMFVGCCGVTNGTDFHTINQHWNRSFYISQGGRNFNFNLTYPVTCCKFNLRTMQPQNPYCPFNNTDSNYRVGCYDKLFNAYIDKYFLDYLFPALAGNLAFQLLLVAGALVIYFAESGKENKVTPAGTVPARRPAATRPQARPQAHPVITYYTGSGVQCIDATQKRQKY